MKGTAASTVSTLGSLGLCKYRRNDDCGNYRFESS